MRVVIATDDKVNLNGHFARCPYFLFYDVTEEACEFVREVCFLPGDGHVEHPHQTGRKPYRVDERISAIKGSDVVFVSAIGGPIADRVIASSVYPMEMNAAESIERTLSKLQALLRGKRPLWLQRILQHDFMFEGPADERAPGMIHGRSENGQRK